MHELKSDLKGVIVWPNLLSGFPVELVPLVGEREDPEAAVLELGSSRQNVGKQQGQAAVVVQPPNVQKAFSLFSLKYTKKTFTVQS